MIQNPDPRSSALIVHAHPEPTSFCTAQAYAARSCLQEQGYAVEFVDLYARGWAPVLRREEFAPFAGAFKPQREQSKAGGDIGLFEQAALAGRRAIVLTTTGGSMDAFRPDGAFGDIDDFLFPIHRGVLEFVGYRALEPVVTYGPAHLDDARRSIALDAVRRAFGSLDTRPPAATTRPAAEAGTR